MIAPAVRSSAGSGSAGRRLTRADPGGSAVMSSLPTRNGSQRGPLREKKRKPVERNNEEPAHKNKVDCRSPDESVCRGRCTVVSRFHCRPLGCRSVVISGPGRPLGPVDDNECPPNGNGALLLNGRSPPVARPKLSGPDRQSRPIDGYTPNGTTFYELGPAGLPLPAIPLRPPQGIAGSLSNEHHVRQSA